MGSSSEGVERDRKALADNAGALKATILQFFLPAASCQSKNGRKNDEFARKNDQCRMTNNERMSNSQLRMTKKTTRFVIRA
jgi:hypothetical protein